jgi:predicted ATP-dependent endonuclease of OLD family
MALKYPIEKIVLCEGITEEILLGEFAKKINYDFDKNGIFLIGAGGKNQVARKYYKMVEEIKLPIFILLDYDAINTKDLILPKLRKKDSVYLIKEGEFEDIIPRKLILNTINNSFKNSAQIQEKDFDKSIPTVKNLKEIYRINGLGDFSKADFAKNVKTNLFDKKQVSEELEAIIKEIKNL